MKPEFLYTFRRCPYAIRARIALVAARENMQVREVVLREKPEHMREISPKATVPVMQLDDGSVIDESIDIVYWALRRNDPNGWLTTADPSEARSLIADNDGDFKEHLDRYKYATRYTDCDPLASRESAGKFIGRLENLLATRPHLLSTSASVADVSIFPFVRQFSNVEPEWFEASFPRVTNWLRNWTTSTTFLSVMPKLPKWEPESPPVLFADLFQAASPPVAPEGS